MAGPAAWPRRRPEPTSAGRPAVLAHGTTVATNALLERRGAGVAPGHHRGLGRRHRDRPPGPAVALRPAGRPARAARAPGPAPRGRRAARRRRHGAGAARRRVGPCPRSPTTSRRWPCACCTPTSTRRHEQAVAEALRRPGPRRDAARTRSRRSSGSTSARSPPWSTPTCGRRCRAYLRGLADAGRRGAGDDLGRRARARGRRRPSCRPRCCSRARPAACGPAPRSRRPTASPTPSPSTWAAPAPTCASSVDGVAGAGGEREVGGFPVRLPVARRAHHRRRRRVDRPHRPRRRARRRAASGRGRARARPATAAAARSRRSPTPTWWPGRIPADAALPGSLARSTSAAASAALERPPGVTAEGVIAVVDAAMEQALRAVSVERGVDPGGLALVAFGGAGPLHACALADALGMAAVVVPARAGVLSAVGILCRPAPARPRALVARRRRPRRARRRARPSWPPRPRPLVAGGATSRWRRRVDCRYAGQSHELTVPDVAVVRTRHERRNGYARPGHPVEVVALRATARRRRPRRRSTDLPAAPTGAGGASAPDRDRAGRARLHGLGGRRLAGRPGRRAAPSSCTRRERSTAASLGPGGAAGADLPPHRRGRGDGRGAAPGRVQPQHQGAGRLLGRPVHRRRRAAGAGRAHPGAPRVDAGRRCAAAIDAFGGGDLAARRPGRPQRPVRRRHPPQRHHAGGAVHRSTAELVGWAANRAHHADVGGVGARVDARRRHRDPAGGPAHPAGPARRRGPGPAARQLPHARRAPGDLDAQVGANVRRRRAPGRAAPTPRSTRSSPTASGGCGPRSPPCPTARGGRRTSLDSTGAGRRPAAAGPHRRHGDRRRRRGRPSTSPAPTPSARGNVNAVEAVTVSGGRLRPALGRRPHDPGQRRRAAAGHGRRPAGTLVAARPPAAVGAGNVEVSQRVADVCLGALAQPCARPGAGRRPGDDEQPADRRRRLGLLRDRRPAGRAAGPTGARA